MTETFGVIAQVHAAIDRGYRELVEALPRRDLLNTACQGLADALGVDLVALVRRDEGGTLECEAASRETALWAEFVRLPERWDGGMAGNGPAARALLAGSVVLVTVDDEGFAPWRAAARDDGLVLIVAAPFDTDDGDWVLLFGAGATTGTMSFRAEDAGGIAMHGCARLIDASGKADQQRLLCASLCESSNAAFVTDADGSIEWCNGALARLTGFAISELVGRNPRFLGGDDHEIRHYRELWAAIRSGRTWRGEIVDRDCQGTAFRTFQTITPFSGRDGLVHYVAIYNGGGRE